MNAPKPLWLARLSGSQEDMGAQHGRLAADDAARLLAFYRALPERALGGDLRGPGGALGRAAIRGVAGAWQARLVRERPAELAARARAFVAAVRAVHPEVAGSPAQAERAMAAMDVLQNCVALAARAGLGPFAGAARGLATAAAAPACSTAIAWGDATCDGELLFARNFDFPGVGVWDAAPAFVACAPDGGQRYGFFTTRGADTPVVTVVNEAGLVMAPHTRWHRGVTFGGAMIVDLVHDIARRAETLADAIAIARAQPASSSWGIAIGSAREKAAVVLELAGGQVEVVRPAPGSSVLVCANRYRSHALCAGQVAASPAWALHSDGREARLRQLVVQRTAPLTMEALARFLGDRGDDDVRHLGGILAQPTNVHAVVVAPAARRALVGIDAAPSCEGRWAELAWAWDGPSGAWHLGETHGSGFTASARDDVAAPHDEATRHLHDAVRAHDNDHDVPAARAALERAISSAPDDPSLRLAGAWLALAEGAHGPALAHIHAGLSLERDTYRRAQLLSWGARAARSSDPALALRYLGELDRLPGADLAPLRASARRALRRPHLNLLLLDAH